MPGFRFEPFGFLQHRDWGKRDKAFSMNSPEFGNIVQSISEAVSDRFADAGLTPELYQENAEIVHNFNNIAAQLLNDQEFLEMPGSPEPISMDEALATQAVSLFAEGIYFAIAKLYEFGIEGEIKSTILQAMALEVYNQSLQVVACTYGQENTPEFQFSIEQQVAMMTQATESHLMFFIGEYEREHGPIFDPGLQQGTQALMPPSGEPLPSIAAPAMPQPQQSQPPPVAQLSAEQPMPAPPVQQAAYQPQLSPEELARRAKFAAVSLLLTTLEAQQRARILQSFSEAEKELITYFSYPQHIEQQLDVSLVQHHLQQFQERMTQKQPAPKKRVTPGIHHLAELNPREKLLSYVENERPAIRAFIDAHYAAAAGNRSRGTGIPGQPQSAAPSATPLPSRVEDILFQYLARQRGIQSEQWATQ